METKKANTYNTIMFCVVGIMVFFFPTSIGGEILTNMMYIYAYYGLCIMCATWYVMKRRIDAQAVIGFIGIMVYMFFASFVSSQILGGSIAIARVVYVLLPAMIFFFASEKFVSYRVVVLTNEILTIVIITWNLCLIFGLGIFPKLTVDYYSQFNWFTTRTFVNRHSPVFTFGIYSYGAFFYALLFLIWIQVITKMRNLQRIVPVRYYVYAIAYIVFQFLMNGSTALMLGAVMLYIFVRMLGKSKWGVIAVPAFLILGVVFISLQDYDWSRMIIGTSTNGFTARYLSNWFRANFNAVRSTILGIGFTVPVHLNLVYTDSGFIVLFTMGNFLLPVCLYGAMYKRLKIVLEPRLFKDVLIIMLMFEFALPGILYIKEIVFLIYFFMSIKAIDEEYL